MDRRAAGALGGTIALAVSASALYAAMQRSAGSTAAHTAPAAQVAPAAQPATQAPPAEERPEVPPPPFSDGIFPCSSCHAEMPVNRTRRELTEMHGDIVLKHDEQHRWCLDCHDAANRDTLHLASGEPVPFEESYRLCGQCHGEKLRDWRAGVHGRRTGHWNGRKAYLLCAHCHNPHEPRFKAVVPMPAPKPPTRPGAAAAGARSGASGATGTTPHERGPGQ